MTLIYIFSSIIDFFYHDLDIYFIIVKKEYHSMTWNSPFVMKCPAKMLCENSIDHEKRGSNILFFTITFHFFKYQIYMQVCPTSLGAFIKNCPIVKKWNKILTIQLLDKSLRVNKIAPLWHVCLTSLSTCAKRVQFYCPSRIYPGIPYYTTN